MSRSERPVRLKGSDLVPDMRPGGGFTFAGNVERSSRARKQEPGTQAEEDRLQILFEGDAAWGLWSEEREGPFMV